jgi:Protein kinase domain
MATATLLRSGDVIGGFCIDDVIGIGGMAIVYRAEQVSLGRPVALKVLSSKLTSDTVFRERFRREGTHAAGLEHPNIVPVYDSGEQDGHLYLAMRLVDGTNLAELIQTRGLTADQTIEILRPIASALDTAHAAGLIHRDVKPQNILVTAQGHPYLADFGVAKGSNTYGLTATGGFVGSVNYASPEQIKGLTLTSASDVYALTAVLFQCLTGHVPYPRETDAGVMHAHLTEPPPTLPTITGADSDFHTVLARGMAKDPGARYGHAGDLINAAGLSVSRLPNKMRKTVPAFPGEVVSKTSPDAPIKPANETEVVAGDGLADLRNGAAFTAADQRRIAAPEPEPEPSDSTRPWPLIAGLGAGATAVIVVIFLLLGSGGGAHSSTSRREARAQVVPAAADSQLAEGLSRSLAPSVAARTDPVGLSSSRLPVRAATARAIAGADSRSAKLLSQLSPQPRDRQAVETLFKGFEREASALSTLAEAAAKGDHSAYLSATAATHTATDLLSSSRATLYDMGFKGLPSLRALSIPGPPPTRHRARVPIHHATPVPSPSSTATTPPSAVAPQATPTPAPTPTPEPSRPAPSTPAPSHHHSESAPEVVVSAPS